MAIKDLVKEMLIDFGEDPNRDGLLDTPQRVEKMYADLLCGYKIDPKSIFRCFDGEQYDGTIEVKNIRFSSLCEHHMLPFYGTVDILYRPNGKIVGLSKLVRLVEVFAKRLQVQERLTKQIAESIMENLHPKGCSVSVRAEHLCMSIRGVTKPGAITETKCTRGCFSE